MTPVIGITSYDDTAAWHDWNARAALLPYAYVDAVRRSGGRPVLLPPGGDADEASLTVAHLDGLVVSGGPAPIRPGTASRATRRPSRPGRSATPGTWPSPARPWPRACRCWRICRGMQVRNVCRGGTLDQHVPDLIDHWAAPRRAGLVRAAPRQVSPDSMLAGILPEPGLIEVPTHHHQAVDLLGDGLRAVAWEEDGLIEAVEAGPSELGGLPGFVLGVQWHPEQHEDARLFGALVGAAAERAAVRAPALTPMI